MCRGLPHCHWWMTFPNKNIISTRSSVSLDNGSNLSPRWLEQWMCRGFPTVTSEWPFQDHLPSKTIVTTWKLCLPGILKKVCTGFPSGTYEWPFQDHLPSKTTVTSWSFVSQEPWTNVQTLPQWNQQMTFLRPSSKWNYHNDWKLCHLGDLTINGQSSPVSPFICIIHYAIIISLHYQCNYIMLMYLHYMMLM